MGAPNECAVNKENHMLTKRRTVLGMLATGLAALLPAAKYAAASGGATRPAYQTREGEIAQRVVLDLNRAADQQQVKGLWRVGPGLVPGEPNEGLVAQMGPSPARLADYDDSGWEVCSDIRERRSIGFTFTWYRIAVELPEQVGGIAVAGSRVLFETNIDNYGEVWIDGQINRTAGGIAGLNAQQRVEVSARAVPGARHVIACLAVNGPLAQPGGNIFIRYATLAFES
jgi:hypothetical protein